MSAGQSASFVSQTATCSPLSKRRYLKVTAARRSHLRLIATPTSFATNRVAHHRKQQPHPPPKHQGTHSVAT